MSVLGADEVHELHGPMEPRERAEAFRRLAASHEALRAELADSQLREKKALASLGKADEMYQKAKARATTAEKLFKELEEKFPEPVARFGKKPVYLVFEEKE